MNNPHPARRRLGWCIRIAAWAYLLFVLTTWLLLYAAGDRWLPATLILFGPRWILSIPLLILVPLASWHERRHLVTLFVAAVILFGPVMNFCVPFARTESGGPVIRVLTCNVGGMETDIGKLRQTIQESRADIVALQECPAKTAEKALSGWKMIHEGGLVIASRYPITPGRGRQAMHPPHRWPRFSLLQCGIHAPGGELSFCSVHLPSPRYGLSNLLDRDVGIDLSRTKSLDKEAELRRKTSLEIESLIRTDAVPMIVAGDFNMPVESAWYRQYWKEYANAFSRAGFGYGGTEQVEIRGRIYKVRIDHILTRGALSTINCRVGSDVGSDHLPLIAELRRTSAEK